MASFGENSQFTNNTIVPKIIAGAFLQAYRKSLVLGARMNNRWRNLLNSGGNQVIINQPATLADSVIKDYTANATVTYDGIGIGSPVTLELEKTKSWAIKFDDLDAQIATLPVLQQAVSDYAYVLARTVDNDIRNAMVAQSVTASWSGATLPMDVASKTEGSVDVAQFTQLGLSRLHLQLDLINVPRAGRWLIIGPYAAAALQFIAMDKIELLAVKDAKINGMVGQFGGFTFYVDPGAGKVMSNSNKTATEVFLAGTNEAFAFIDTIRKTERLRLQNTFADAVRGLYQYGYKAVRANQLLQGTFVCKSNTALPLG